MIYYIPGLTFQEQIQVWLNSTDGEEYNLGKYLEIRVEESIQKDRMEAESYSEGYREGFADGKEVGYDEGYSVRYSE